MNDVLLLHGLERLEGDRFPGLCLKLHSRRPFDCFNGDKSDVRFSHLEILSLVLPDKKDVHAWWKRLLTIVSVWRG